MWDKYQIEEERTYHWKLDETSLWVKKSDNEWLIAVDSSGGTDAEVPEGVKWKSVVTKKGNSLNVLPALPDRPVVVKPLGEFKLLPDTIIQLYIPIPLWVQFYNGPAEKRTLISEHPVISMSSTWFGDSDNGILSYTNSNEAKTRLERSKSKGYEAICPLIISNDDSSTLNFQRLLINVEFLSIYMESGLLFTSEIKVKFKGENAVADIQYGQSAPSFLKNASLLAVPRNPERKSVLRKSFHFIKSLTEY